ncbi:MAG: GNAT family N-acetyltransferase [Sneathiellaceae bacterium]
MTYAIRPARPDEAGLIVEIEDQAADLFAVFGLAQVADMPTGDRAFYDACIAAGTVWVAVPAGQSAPIGFAAAAVRDHALWLAELAVLPAHGRRGVGGRLMRTVIDWATRRRLPAVELTTFRDLPFNAPFYARLGFTPFEPGADRPHLAGIRRNEIARGLDALQPRQAMRLRLSLPDPAAP